MPTYDTNYGAKRAREARERFGLDDASPVRCILTLVEERAELPVVVGALPSDIAGALWRNGAGSSVWVNGAQSVERQRFTVAHELGHVCCRHDGTAIDTDATLSGRTHESREVQANAFAAELLAPRAGVAQLVGRDPNLEEVVRLGAHFGISTIAAFYRCSTLGLLSDRRYDQLRAEIEDNLHKYFAAEPLRDELSGITEYPRLPAALADSALAAVLRGEASVGAAASKAGVDADRLAAAAAALSR
jgi:Zn-dependent peptidase ImmA (M78 family)